MHVDATFSLNSPCPGAALNHASAFTPGLGAGIEARGRGKGRGRMSTPRSAFVVASGSGDQYTAEEVKHWIVDMFRGVGTYFTCEIA